MKTATEIQEILVQCTGTFNHWKLPIANTLYTDGINDLAESAEAYWMLTDTSLVAKELMRKSHFISITFQRLTKEQQEEQLCEATITYDDAPKPTNGFILKIIL
jgi:hypothetical protein